jgi:hypothetical protein
MSVIADLLDRLAAERKRLASVEQAIAIQAGPLEEQRQCLEAACKKIEEEIKGKAKFVPTSQAHTLLGRTLQLVWSGRTTVDQDALQDLFDKYGVSDADRAAVLSSSGSWSIRKRGKGK